MKFPLCMVKLFVCFLLLLSGITLAGATSLVVDNETSEIHLHHQILTYIDPDNTSSIEDILQNNKESLFSNEHDVFGRTYYHDFWAKFDITSTVNKNWFLLLEPPWLDRVEFYLVNQQNQVVSKKVIDRRIPFAEREVRYRSPVIQFKLPASEHFTVYLKISNANGVIRGIDLLSFDRFVFLSSNSQMIWGTVLGIYFLLVLGSIWFERASKEGIYRSFSIYVFFCLWFNIILTGWWNQLFFPSIDLSHIHLMGVVGLWLVYTSVRFYFKYVNVEKFHPRIGPLFLRSLLFLTLIYSMVMLLGDQYVMIRIYLQLLIYFILPVSFILIIKPIYKSQSEIKKILILVIVLYALSFLYSALTVIGVFQKNDLNLYINTLCELFVFLSIFYSLSKKYELMRKDKEDAQRQLLEVSKNTQLELEKQVSSKTKELILAQEALEVSLKNERKVYQDQKNFVGMVSHELRTPLSVINASIQNLLRNKKITDETVHQKFDNIQVSVKRLTSLIDDYLNNERLDASSEKIDYEWISIRSLFEEAISAVEPLFSDHHYEIKLRNSTLILWADKYLLKLILHSLVENAAKYTAPGTTISFNAVKTEIGWHVIVSDNGFGIPENDKPYIFDRYYRGSQSSNHIGTGLGLSLSRQLAELMGGSLTLMNTSDQGCRFSVFLPDPALSCF